MNHNPDRCRRNNQPAATTQGVISAVVLLMELTGQDRSFIPLLLTASIATLLARSIEPRSLYDARLMDEEIEARQKLREAALAPPGLVGESKS